MRYERSVVLGGGVAGLLSASALSRHSREVIIIDRAPLDRISSGCPQVHQCHVMLLRGQQILEEFFPGFLQKAAGYGAASVDFLNDIEWILNGVRMPRLRSSLHGYYATRSFWERHLREEVRKLGNVRFMHETVVKGIDRSRAESLPLINSISVESAAGFSKSLNISGLVVDAMGGGSIARTCFDPLKTIQVDQRATYIGYATQIFARPTAPCPWKVLLHFPSKDNQGVVVFPIENNQWLITLIGYNGDYPPTDDRSFFESAKKLLEPYSDQIPGTLDAVGPVFPFRIPHAKWRRYDLHQKLLPSNYLALGDAICNLNPTFGQGMTVAALESQTLSELLATALTHEELISQYWKRVGCIVRKAWKKDGELSNSSSILEKFQHIYDVVFSTTAHRDGAVYEDWVKINHFLSEPATSRSFSNIRKCAVTAFRLFARQLVGRAEPNTNSSIEFRVIPR